MPDHPISRFALDAPPSPGDAATWDAVRAAQEQVAAHALHPNYVAAYREDERTYWELIPDWIVRDFGQRTLQRRIRSLDVGCAYGTLTRFLQLRLQAEAHATDFIAAFMNPDMVRRWGLHFSVSNIELQPLPFPGPFDLIVFTEVLEHLNFHPRHTLEKLAQALGPKGRLYLSTPDSAEWGRVSKYYSSLDAMPAPRPGQPTIDDHIYVYSKEELFDLAWSAGLVVLRFGYSRGSQKRHLNATLRRRSSASLGRPLDRIIHRLSAFE